MHIQRIKAILLHEWYHLRHAKETWVDLFWNPGVQMILFVLIARALSIGSESELGLYMLSGMIFWNVIWVGQYGMVIGALWEIWSDSLSSLFVSPLTMQEFLIGEMISGGVKAIAAVLISDLIARLFYGFSIVSLGWISLVYFLELIVFSWAVGMLILNLILRYGTDIQSLSWSVIFIVQPFGAVFYPLSILPDGIRTIALGLPPTYVFEAIREQITSGQVNLNLLFWASIVNLAWFGVGYLVLIKGWQAAKKSGAFARLEA